MCSYSIYFGLKVHTIWVHRSLATVVGLPGVYRAIQGSYSIGLSVQLDLGFSSLAQCRHVLAHTLLVIGFVACSFGCDNIGG